MNSGHARVGGKESRYFLSYTGISGYTVASDAGLLPPRPKGYPAGRTNHEQVNKAQNHPGTHALGSAVSQAGQQAQNHPGTHDQPQLLASSIPPFHGRDLDQGFECPSLSGVAFSIHTPRLQPAPFGLLRTRNASKPPHPDYTQRHTESTLNRVQRWGPIEGI